MDEIIAIKDLQTCYVDQGNPIAAVDRVSLTLNAGETVAVVGESGCGKSTLAKSIMRLHNESYTRITEGSICFEGRDLLTLTKAELRKIRGNQITMIFQNPLSALDPLFTIRQQMSEMFEFHGIKLKPKERDAFLIELLQKVQISSPEERLSAYPHQLSGGMQQRILIAMAIVLKPRLIIADEPTTALDVTTQAQILYLLHCLQQELQSGMLLITHDLGIVSQYSDRVCVMYAGVVMEEAATEKIFADPTHPYTQALLKVAMSLPYSMGELYSIPGTVRKFRGPVKQCRFCERCDKAIPRCRDEEPPLFNLADGSKVRCWLYEEETAND